jgi:TonB family protein
MKNFSSFCFVVLLWAAVGFGCKNNPLATQPKLYNCTIAGEPEPKTSDEFFERARKHIASYPGNTNMIDDCALAALNEAIRLDPNNVKALRVRGYNYNLRKNYDLALADYDKLIEIEPDNPDNYSGRVYSYEYKGLLDKAIEDQTTVLKLLVNKDLLTYEKLSKEYKKRSDLYAKKGDFANATKDLSEASRLIKTTEMIENVESNNTKPKVDKTVPNSSDAISGGVLNGKAINLVQPPYPPAAKAVRASGTVNVQVLLDIDGNVISATAVSGHALLKAAAESAARSSKFKPTVVNGKAVKVTGVIVYNFTLQ